MITIFADASIAINPPSTRQILENELALEYFTAAYELSGHRPSTILALAQCERVLGDFDAAIGHYEEYLAVEPTPADAPRVRERLEVVKEAKTLAERRAAETEAQAEADAAQRRDAEARRLAAEIAAKLETKGPPPPSAEPSGDDFWSSPWPWVIAGALVVGGGAAAGIVIATDGDGYDGGTSGITLEP